MCPMVKREQIDLIFSKSLRSILDTSGVKGAQSRVAEKVGVTPQHISAISLGKRGGDEGLKREIAKALGYEYEDFLDLARANKTLRTYTGTPDGDYYSAPLIDGRIAAGPGALVDEYQIKSKVWIYAPELRDRRRHKLTAVQVSETNGRSMIPTIAPGDIVLIDHDDPSGAKRLFKSGKIYAVRTSRTDPDTAIKRVYESNGNLVLASDNKEFAPEVAWSNDINEIIVGRVVWGWRNLLTA